MLKGKSKIELFDAATGEKLLEQRDSNLVTNALDTVANCRDKMGLLRWWRPEGSTVSTDLSFHGEHLAISPACAMMPLYKRALGGVLLWDGNIAEDPSVMVPPADVDEVGHAGGEYGGSNIYRGSYNANESGEISGGYRHVWDFDTDKANGVIKCLSLTSCHGGNLGYRGDFDTEIYPRYNGSYFHKDSRYYDASAIGVISFEGLDEIGRTVYIRKMEDNSLRVYRRNDTEVWYLKISDPTKAALQTVKPANTGRVTLPITPIDKYSGFYLYKGQFHEIAKESSTRLRHRIFGIDGEQLSDKTLDLPFTISNGNFGTLAVYRDGYYYCLSHADTDLVKLDERGNEVSRIPMLRTNAEDIKSVTINEFNGEILFGTVPSSGSSFHYTYALNTKDTLGVISNLNYPTTTQSNGNYAEYSQYIKTDDPCSPFAYYNDATRGIIIPLVNTGYLATINNLQAPITKTPAQTMKITYEIYDE